MNSQEKVMESYSDQFHAYKGARKRYTKIAIPDTNYCVNCMVIKMLVNLKISRLLYVGLSPNVYIIYVITCSEEYNVRTFSWQNC